jgi:HlyD family secretion protein
VMPLRGLIWSVTLVMLATGCGRTTDSPVDAGGASPQSSVPAARVATVRPERKSLRRITAQPGQIDAFEEAPIFARASGYVERLAVDIGDRVRGPQYDSDGRITEPGQVLAEIAVPELRDELRQKQAMVVQAESAIAQATAAADVAETKVAAARARCRESEAMVARTEADAERWRLEFERISKLVANRAVEQKLADETKNQWASAQAAQTEAAARVDAAAADLAETRASVLKAQADEAVVRAQHRVMQADLQYAQTMLDYATLRAPFDGVVTQRNINTGHFVQTGSGEQRQPLFVVTQADVVRVFLDVPETEAPLVDVGDAAEITVDALARQPVMGKVTRTGWSLHAATRTLRTEVDIPNPDGKLRPGMYVHVAVVLDERSDALVVPASAIVSDGSRPFCVAVLDGKAVMLPVDLGMRAGGEVEITSGLTGDEILVRSGAAGLVDGQPLVVVTAS